MSSLFLVRHGKASNLAKGEYDKLSKPGWAQARTLGDYWAQREMRFDRVFVGPLRRQRETAEAVGTQYGAAELDWPDHELVEALNEHAGVAIFQQALPKLVETEPVVREVLEKMTQGEALHWDLKWRVFQRAMTLWVAGELPDADQHESWDAFRARAAEGLAELTSDTSSKQQTVAFTSGGFISAAVGHILGLNDLQVVELSWQIRNGSYTEVVYSEGRVSLASLNCCGYLAPDMVTLV